MTSPVGTETYDADLVAEVERTDSFQELGVTGLRRSAGYLDEEFLPQLRGPKAVKIYREMSDNDPIIGAMVFAIQQLIRNAVWNVVPAGKSREHADAAKLVETCKDDMSASWDEMVQEALSCIIYGWSWHEIVYKRRVGPWEKDGSTRSKYTDGLVGWRKMPIRSQDTLQRWVFDETGGVKAMIQMGPPDYSQRVLPINRSLLFRYGTQKGSPEGRSMLRNAYRPWFYKKRHEEFESIGVERDLAGLPKVTVPAEWLRSPVGSPQYKQVEQLKKMVRSVRRNEQEGMIFPAAFDPDTKQPLFEFELVGGGGARQFQVEPIIERLKTEILQSVLADFIMVGHTRTGSYNMHIDKTGIFRTALNSLLRSIVDVINRHAIPRLFELNGWKPAELPRFQVEDVDAPDITQLAAFMSQTAQLGFTWGPDADLDTYLRKAAGLPAKVEEATKRERVYASRAESTRYAEGQTAYIAARSELAMAMAQAQQQAAGEPGPEEAQQLGQAQAAQGDQAAAQEQAQVDQQRAGEQHEDAMATSRLQRMKEIKDMTTPEKPAAKAKK